MLDQHGTHSSGLAVHVAVALEWQIAAMCGSSRQRSRSRAASLPATCGRARRRVARCGKAWQPTAMCGRVRQRSRPRAAALTATCGRARRHVADCGKSWQLAAACGRARQRAEARSRHVGPAGGSIPCSIRPVGPQYNVPRSHFGMIQLDLASCSVYVLPFGPLLIFKYHDCDV